MARIREDSFSEERHYEVVVTLGGKKHSVQVDAAGNIEGEAGGKAKEEEREGEEAEKHGVKKEGKEGENDID